MVNLTEPIQLSGTSSMSDTFESFFSSDNNTDFFTFAHDSIQDSYNFTVLLDSTVPNDYSHDLWGGDIGLVIFVTNQSLSLQYKVLNWCLFIILWGGDIGLVIFVTNQSLSLQYKVLNWCLFIILWGGDIGLVIFVTNQSLSLQYKVLNCCLFIILWGSDIGLVIFVTNQSLSLQYKVLYWCLFIIIVCLFVVC